MRSDLTPVSTKEFVSGESFAVFDQLDDHTVSFTFAEPNGLFMDRLASPGFATSRIIMPRHYFAQFHPKYTRRCGGAGQEGRLRRLA